MIITNVKVTTFSRAAFSYLAIQPSFDINIMKLAFGSPRRNFFNHGFVWSQNTAPIGITAPRNIKLVQCTQTPPSQGTNSHLG